MDLLSLTKVHEESVQKLAKSQHHLLEALPAIQIKVYTYMSRCDVTSLHHYLKNKQLKLSGKHPAKGVFSTNSRFLVCIYCLPSICLV